VSGWRSRMSEPVLYDLTDGVGTVTLNRPEAMNSLDTATKVALRDVLEAAADDSSVRCVVLTGNGRAFCAGQDLREHVDDLANKPLEEIWSTVPEHYSRICSALATMPKPVVAGVNGIAAGAGASLALACDFRIVADAAGFNLAFARIGLSCDTGLSWTLPRLVGRAMAMELLMLSGTVSADEALRLGIATKVVASESLSDEVRRLAGELAAGPTVAFASIRRSLTYAASHSLAETLVFEGEMMANTGKTEDHRDAVAAFAEKRKPTFHGR
jgi:2-(1,2-epoxy-1,2-dihydrophenyl)acetyl-CoA isomerase